MTPQRTQLTQMVIFLVNVFAFSQKSLAASLTSPTTSLTASSASCDFEAADLCGWEPVPSTGYTFKRHQGPTPDSTSGPYSDHTLKGNGTTGASGHYVFTSGWDAAGPNDTASLYSPPLLISLPSNLTFWYQMNGQGIGSLTVYLYQMREGTRMSRASTLWAAHGRQGQNWKSQEITLLRGFWQIEFRTTIIHSYGSDIALDDISFDPPVYIHVIAPVTSATPVSVSAVTSSSISLTTSMWTSSTLFISSLTTPAKSTSPSTLSSTSTRSSSKTLVSSLTLSPTSPSNSSSKSTTSLTKLSTSSFTSSASGRFSSTTSSANDNVTPPKVSPQQTSEPTSSGTSTATLTSTRTHEKSTSSTQNPELGSTVPSETDTTIIFIITSVVNTQTSTNASPSTTSTPRTTTSTSITITTLNPTTSSSFPTLTPTTTTKKPFILSSMPGNPDVTTKKENVITPTLKTTKNSEFITMTSPKKHDFPDVGNNASHGSSQNSAERHIIIGLSMGVLALLILLGVVYECWRQKRSKNEPLEAASKMQGKIQQVIALHTVHVHQQEENGQVKEEAKILAAAQNDGFCCTDHSPSVCRGPFVKRLDPCDEQL